MDQEKFWSLPLRGFRLGRNSTADLLHLLWPYEKKPDDAWCCNLHVFKSHLRFQVVSQFTKNLGLESEKTIYLNVYIYIYTHLRIYIYICVCIQLCKIIMSQVTNSECKMGFGHCCNVGVEGNAMMTWWICQPLLEFLVFLYTVDLLVWEFIYEYCNMVG